MSVFSASSERGGRIQVLYKVVGEGTRYLSQQARGARLLTLGPLGNGFRLPRRRRGPDSILPVMIAGGVGIAIFPFLSEALLRSGQRPLLLFGGRSRKDLVALSTFRSRGVGMRLATEDGSLGARGHVTRLLEPLLEDAVLRPALRLYACGPSPMLAAVGALAEEAGVPCQLALEATMPCGIGVCLGCVVPVPVGGEGPAYRRVCTEGPIFEAGEVLL